MRGRTKVCKRVGVWYLSPRHCIVDKQGQGLGVGITGSVSVSVSDSDSDSDGCWLIDG